MGLEDPLFFATAVRMTITPEEIEAALAEALPAVDVIDIEMAGSAGNPTLRVYIDHPEGVDHDLCVKVTGLLDRYLDDQAVEVSSPGLERRLRKPEHFRSVVGEKINVRTFGPVEGQRNFTGFLIAVKDDMLQLDIEGREMMLSLDQVARARKIFEFPGEAGEVRGDKKSRKRRR